MPSAQESSACSAYQHARTPLNLAVSREGTYLRYTANTVALGEVLSFLYAECCTRNKAVKPEKITQICK